jgi:hypothetical protein
MNIKITKGSNHKNLTLSCCTLEGRESMMINLIKNKNERRKFYYQCIILTDLFDVVVCQWMCFCHKMVYASCIIHCCVPLDNTAYIFLSFRMSIQ